MKLEDIRQQDEGPAALRLVASVWKRMLEHAGRTLPEECCGLLAGPSDVCTVLYELENEDHSPVRYSAEPRSLIAAFRDMRQRGLELKAIYHSHPTSPAVPSRTDLAENYYGTVPRIIISLASAEPDVRAYVLFPDSWRQIELVILPESPAQPGIID